MDERRRAAIIAESLKNLERFRNETSSASDVEHPPQSDRPARAADRVSSSFRSAAPPPLDDVERFRREGEAFERMRMERKAAIRAEEQQHTARDQSFWQSVDGRIAAALDAERAFMSDMLRDTVAAVVEITDATSDKIVSLDTKLGKLSDLLKQLREGNERHQRQARAARTRAERTQDDDDVLLPGEIKTVN